MQEIEGILQIDNKIWFNDKERCRLRICGFTKEQIEKMSKSKFIDITITKCIGDEITKAYILISEEYKGVK